MNRPLLFLLSSLVLAGTAHLHGDALPAPPAEEPKAPAEATDAPANPGANALAAPVGPNDWTASPNIRIEIQIVAIPEPLSVAFINEMKDKTKIEAAYVKVQDLLAKGTAKLIGWPMAITRSGQRAIIEAIHEIRYATEYAPPTVGVNPDVAADAEVKVEPKLDVTALAGLPSAFETRNAGVTLEVEPVLGPDMKTIDLNIVPQHVRLKGFEKVTLEGAAGRTKTIVEQPRFDTMKVTTSVTMLSGHRLLLGVFRTDDPPKHFEFFILKVETVPVD